MTAGITPRSGAEATEDATGPAAERATAKRRFKPSITTALVLGFGTLIVAGMIVVLSISMWSAQKNTRTLLADNAKLAMLSLVRETRRRLAPVQDTSAYLASLIDEGRVSLSDRDALAKTLLTAMAGDQQLFGMAFVFADGKNVRVRRGVGQIRVAVGPDALDIRNAVAEARRRHAPFWGKPLWLAAAKSTVVAYRTPIWQGDTFRGVLIAGVTVNALSRFIARSADAPLTGNRFILYGRDHVLAHANMAKGGYKRNADIPLPRLNEVGDPVVARMWDTEGARSLPIALGEGMHGHLADVGGKTFMYLYREMDGFGDVPLTVGIYAGPDDGLGVEMNRLMWAGLAGIAVILVSVAGAVLLGRGMSAPIKKLAEGSSALADLDLDRVSRLKPSRLRELDEASAAFNRLTAGMRWFETYVPRELVRRLITRDAPVSSEEKQVTVMFTDISGFATLSEHMPATETADLLNAHFSILAACIEEEHGTVDKYIGDSVMAFWEPDDDDPNVDRALRAARKIRARILADNADRRRRGEPAVTVRIGIHTGYAIVGNIGAPGRINYTLVGDTVNVAARLEQLGKEMGPDIEAAILVSGETAALAQGDFGLVSRGRHELRGRDSDVEIFSLDR